MIPRLKSPLGQPRFAFVPVVNSTNGGHRQSSTSPHGGLGREELTLKWLQIHSPNIPPLVEGLRKAGLPEE
jgi:hypothetical protein